MTFQIPVVTNSFFDLTRFDFSFVDICIYNVDSEEFKEYIRQVNPDFFEGNFSFFRDIIEKIYGEFGDRYAIVKKDFKNDYDEDNLYNVYLLLLIIFPSGLNLEHIVHYNSEHDFVQRAYMSTMEKRYVEEHNYLNYDGVNLPLVNEFIAIVFDKMKTESFVGLSIQNYINSYTASHIHFQYITLCMSLENLTTNASELSYRLKRITSILCGKDSDNCVLIFSNISKIYKLRSTIVHGDNYDIQKVNQYLSYLTSLVSICIIELLIHDIDTTVELDNKITALGFGQREKLSENWKNYDINALTRNKVDKIL